MTMKELKSIDISSYTIIMTGINVLISIILSIIMLAIFTISVPNSFMVMFYVVPTIIFGTMICNIFTYFTEGYLYNVLSKRLGFIKLDIEGEYIKEISSKETALNIGCITLIMVIIIYFASSLIMQLLLSSFIMTIYFVQPAIAAILYNIMIVISNPIFIAVVIIVTAIISAIFALIGTYIYNILADSERGILVKLTTEDKFTKVDSITPLNFAIAIGAIALILNIVLGIIMMISGVPIFAALIDILMSFVGAFIASYIFAAFYNFLAPKIGELKVELE